MTLTATSPSQSLPTQNPLPKQGEPKQTVPTAGTPEQAPAKESWFKRNIKLVGIVGGAAVGAGIGFLTLGPMGALGGAAIGALAGYLLTRNSGTTGSVKQGGDTSQLPPPLPR